MANSHQTCVHHAQEQQQSTQRCAQSLLSHHQSKQYILMRHCRKIEYIIEFIMAALTPTLAFDQLYHNPAANPLGITEFDIRASHRVIYRHYQVENSPPTVKELEDDILMNFLAPIGALSIMIADPGSMSGPLKLTHSWSCPLLEYSGTCQHRSPSHFFLNETCIALMPTLWPSTRTSWDSRPMRMPHKYRIIAKLLSKADLPRQWWDQSKPTR
jgi:hypothetical protein